MPKKNGFIFVETVIVTCVLLASLMVIYSLYVTSINTESRYTRYDDPAKLYESYYLSKYFQSFDFRYLIQNLKDPCTYTDRNQCLNESTCNWNSASSSCKKSYHYELIWQGRSDIFGNLYAKEAVFFDSLWSSLHIKNIYLISSDVSNITRCSGDIYNQYQAICDNESLMGYLNTLDDGNTNEYYMIFEFESQRDGKSCVNNSGCLGYYAYIKVSDI